MPRTPLALCLYAALTLPTLALSQTQTAQAPTTAPLDEAFGEQIDVRVVNVEAVVTDRQGHRVDDLKPDDFRLKVDGKEVPVSFFSEVREGKAAGAAAVPDKPDRATVAPAGGVGPGEAVGTRYLLFIDDYFSTAVRRNEVLKSLKKDLAGLGPSDKMAVVAFDGARLARLSAWTGSADELGRVLDQAMARPAHGLDRVSELRSFLQSQDFSEQVESDPTADKDALVVARPQTPDRIQQIASGGLNMQERAYGDVLVRQIDGAVSAAVSAMRGAGSTGGRKVMLLLSGGWPFSVQGFLRGADSLSPTPELPDGEHLLRPLTLTANLLGFTLYPVDVPGIETTAADATSFGAQPAGNNLREQEVEGALHFLADETGGRPLLNGLRQEAFPTVAADVRSYYWLGFTPTWERNDRRHRVELEVLRKGLRIRSRNSFLDLSPRAELSMRMESALLLGSLPDAVPMPMRLGPLVRTKTETEVPISLGLPVAALTILAVEGKFRAHVDLRFAASDENGNRSDVPDLPVDLTAATPPKANGFVRYNTTLRIRGKAHHLVVAAYDPLSGKIATAEADLTP